MKQMKLSVGVSDFEKIRSDGYYYIDKSGWIKGLLKSGAEVTLLTRPRRFGKTLGMSMLANFFDITKLGQCKLKKCQCIFKRCAIYIFKR